MHPYIGLPCTVKAYGTPEKSWYKPARSGTIVYVGTVTVVEEGDRYEDRPYPVHHAGVGVLFPDGTHEEFELSGVIVDTEAAARLAKAHP